MYVKPEHSMINSGIKPFFLVQRFGTSRPGRWISAQKTPQSGVLH
jgi:hypothetical protein